VTQPADRSEREAERLTLTLATIIVNYRTPDLVSECVTALAAERELLPMLKVVVVDGGSGDDSLAKLNSKLAKPVKDGWLTILPLSFNGGFGWANNQAISLLTEKRRLEFVHLLNPDTVVRYGAVAALLSTMQDRPHCGAAGSQLLSPNGHASGSAFRFPSIGREFLRGANTPMLARLLRLKPLLLEPNASEPIDWVTGASVMIRTEALRQVGLFDEGFFLYYEDVELMHRIRAHGWEICHVADSLVEHIGGSSTGVGDVEGGMQLPDYWFEARRRYFNLVYGRAGYVAANIAWLTGRMLWTIRCMAGLGSRNSNTVREVRGLFKQGLGPGPKALARRHHAVLGAPPTAVPAWARQDERC
jgi:N-acetylglucosaminyl-diphospho-decaprenol L-rhamnosyltransferase